MSLALADIQSWLTAANVGAPILINRLPDAPDVCVVAMVTPGGALLVDGAFRTSHVNFRCRSGPDDDAAAEALATAVDDAFVSTDGSFQMGSTYVLYVEALAAPAYAGRDVDRRTLYTATYQFACPT